MEAYAVFVVAAAAIDQAKADKAQAIRDAIKQVNLAETPFGPVKFDARGQNQHPVLVTQVQGGQYKVVWPIDAAELGAAD
jgi:ABC-type branched-subunit amino acid transport system substrate-binding protein